MKKLILLVLAASLAGSAHAEVIQFQEAKAESSLSSTQLREPDSSSMSFGISSWVPNHLRLPSRIWGESDFGSTGLPTLEASYHFPVRILSQSFELGLGGSWVLLKRSGNLDEGGFQIPQSQTLNLAALRLGVEYAPMKLRTRWFSPYLSLAALPSVGITARSTFDPGYTYLGIAGEAGLGSRLRLSAVGLPWNNADLDLGLGATLGALENASLNGFGIRAGLRVNL